MMNESRKIEEILDRLEPTEALAALTPGLRKPWPIWMKKPESDSSPI